MMLSEGRPGIDNCFRLKDGTLGHLDILRVINVCQRLITNQTGILTLELEKESYERAGLVGKSVWSGGRRHVKSRYRMIPLSCYNRSFTV